MKSSYHCNNTKQVENFFSMLHIRPLYSSSYNVECVIYTICILLQEARLLQLDFAKKKKEGKQWDKTTENGIQINAAELWKRKHQRYAMGLSAEGNAHQKQGWKKGGHRK